MSGNLSHRGRIMADLTAATKFSGFSVTQCKDGFVYTAPVASFKPNGFGLYDTAGNVWSWTGDCWNETNKGNPGTGAARKTGDCSRIAVRGGSWMDSPQMLHVALRNGMFSDGSADNMGFRVARSFDE